MCICFIFASTELDDRDDFQVIIANNRDEYYARPTKPAHFWNAHCLSGTIISMCLISSPLQILQSQLLLDLHIVSSELRKM